jgi:hypothetical protein
VLLNVILGGVIGVAGAFLGTLLQRTGDDEEERRKMEEVRKTLMPEVIRERIGE